MRQNKPYTYQREPFIRYAKKHYELYLLLLPALVFVVMFKLLPFLGNILAFQEFDLFSGDNLLDSIVKSPFCGFDNFKRMFVRAESLTVILNTFLIIVYKTVFLFPIPIVLALLIHEIRWMPFKRYIQTILFFPYFLSWTVVGALFLDLLQADGMVNHWLGFLGIQAVPFFTDYRFFRTLLVMTEVWRSAGWIAVVYLAAMTAIDPQLYEAAIVDGANRFQRAVYITIPCILPTIAMLSTITLGGMIAFGSFEQVFVLYNPAVYKTGDIIQTFTFRVGLGQLDFSFATAVGFFNSVVGFITILVANKLCKRFFRSSIW